ncbi:uncharacterized protein Bfra_011704 [Botrytis fragariae]|uniref:Uncharacterized protein n=1 Tax=Botrytis fragariae TaxID=1964551 RepID=A0A8H6EEG0_9HELO|nr:uncharacterized protein Bfra_011704 [Botrytis fragariae]KAF5869161.1 hypothetical protein Bfra_011704 [Botrytis fragariae]
MSGVSETKSSLWFEWDDATLKRKANATQSDNAQDYADRHAARAIRKGRKEWTDEEVMKKASASRYDYENYEDRHVAKAINKRDRNDASREAHEKAETAMATLSINGPPSLPRDRGTAFKDAIYYDDLKSGKEPQKRKPKVPLDASQLPSGSGNKSRADNEGVQGRDGRGSEREKGKRNRSASASRTRDSLKKPATASSSSSNKPSTATSSNLTQPRNASSSNPTGGTEPKPMTDYPYTQNKEGRYICTRKGCETKSYSERSRFRSHYDTKHTHSAKLYYCELGEVCREEPFDRHDSYIKHLRSNRHQEKQAEHDDKVNKNNNK